jgi:hypothetical protein
MLIDLTLVGILALAGWRMFWPVAAIVLFRMARATTGGIFSSRVARITVRLVATGILIATASVWFATCANPVIPIPGVEGPDGTAGLRLMDVLQAPARFRELAGAESDSAAAAAAEVLVGQLVAVGTSAEDLRGIVGGLVDEGDLPEERGAIALSVIDRLAAEPSDGSLAAAAGEDGSTDQEVSADSLVVEYAAALQTGDSARIAELREPLVEAVARARISRLTGRVDALENEQDDLEDQLAEERRVPGIRRIFQGLLDDLGLSFGWMAIYFTAFVALWRGHTPGKRALGIRIVRLSGKPISWWIAFERFGGYGASVFTGMLGFFEMLWDANRQALHDKVARTVVILERKK